MTPCWSTPASASDTDSIIRRIDEAGVPTPSVSRILITHAHPDHSVGSAITGRTARRAGIGRTRHGRHPASRRPGRRRTDGRARAADCTRHRCTCFPTDVGIIEGGDTLSVGRLTVPCASPRPGHAAGHLCFAVDVGGRTVLFSGDLVFSRGRVALLATPDCDLTQLAAVCGASLHCRPMCCCPATRHSSLTTRTSTRHRCRCARRAATAAAATAVTVIGIVGVGSIGTRHARIFSSINDVTVIVYDAVTGMSELRDRLGPDVQVAPSLEALMGHGVDGLVRRVTRRNARSPRSARL